MAKKLNFQGSVLDSGLKINQKMRLGMLSGILYMDEKWIWCLIYCTK